MHRFKKIIISISILLALLTTYIGHTVFQNELEKRMKNEIVYVPVAKRDIPSMKKITPEDITMIELESESVKKLPIITTEQEVLDKITHMQIRKGSPFLNGQILDEDEGVPFPIKDGKRAITIPSSPIISVGNYVEPGHFVDVFWTYTTEEGEQHTTLIQQNMKVLAVGGPSSNLSVAETANTITLLADPTQAQQLAFMNQQGTIKLALRGSPLEPNVQLEDMNIETLLNSN